MRDFSQRIFCENATDSRTKRHCERNCTRESRAALQCKGIITPGFLRNRDNCAAAFREFPCETKRVVLSFSLSLSLPLSNEGKKKAGERGCCTRAANSMPEISLTSSKFAWRVLSTTGARNHRIDSVFDTADKPNPHISRLVLNCFDDCPIVEATPFAIIS